MSAAAAVDRLLHLCEEGAALRPHERAAAILALVGEMPEQEALELPVGARDARLLRLREATFGAGVDAVADCPSCGEPCELAFRTSDFTASEPPRIITLEANESLLRVRLPSTADLTSAFGEQYPRRALLERCLLDPVPEFDDALIERIEAAMESADPLADIRIEIACPLCAHRWVSLFDVATFLWSEIRTWATRLLGEVHLLASAYGWRESDILAMSAWRRQQYLGLIGA